MSPDLILALLDLTELARPSWAYCNSNGIDWQSTVPATGGVYLAPIKAIAPRYFDFDDEGHLAAVCEALDEDGETVIDLVAWSVTDPARVRTMFGRAPALGMTAAVNPATYYGDRPLRLFRTPLGWLMAGCEGAVILDPARGARWLLDVPTTKVAAEDDDHAREIAKARAALVEAQAIVVPTGSKPSRLRDAA